MMMELFDEQEVLRSYVQSEKHDAVKEAAKDLREAVHPVTRLLLYRIYHILVLIANTTSRFPTSIFYSPLNMGIQNKLIISVLYLLFHLENSYNTHNSDRGNNTQTTFRNPLRQIK